MPDAPADNLLDQLIDILEDEKVRGVEVVDLADENLQFLLEPGTRQPVAKKSAPQRSQQAQPRERAPERASERAPTPAPAPAHQAPREPEPARAAAPQAPPTPAPAAPVPPKPTNRPELSQLTLDELEKVAAACNECVLCQHRQQAVFGDGNPNAELMFIGEGPGAEEDAQGIPFVGPAGQLLTKIIQAMQFNRDDVYIANIIKCRPPRNRNPEDDEAKTCLPILERQIELVKPTCIITLGAVPLKYLLNVRGVTRRRGQWLEYKGIPVMPTFHPSYLLRKPESKREVWQDMQNVMERFGLDPSKSKKQR